MVASVSSFDAAPETVRARCKDISGMYSAKNMFSNPEAIYWWSCADFDKGSNSVLVLLQTRRLDILLGIYVDIRGSTALQDIENQENCITRLAKIRADHGPTYCCAGYNCGRWNRGYYPLGARIITDDNGNRTIEQIFDQYYATCFQVLRDLPSLFQLPTSLLHLSLQYLSLISIPTNHPVQQKQRGRKRRGVKSIADV
jgi:hypothetical protein